MEIIPVSVLGPSCNNCPKPKPKSVEDSRHDGNWPQTAILKNKAFKENIDSFDDKDVFVVKKTTKVFLHVCMGR